MSNCKSSAVSTYEKYSGVAQFIASSIGKSIAGQAYATFLRTCSLSQPLL